MRSGARDFGHALLAAFATAVMAVAPAAGQNVAPKHLPTGLVHLSDVDASILQDMRYATADNFTGVPLPGYGAAECILTRRAATALAAVQSDLRATGLSLKVYDCYRPRRASRAMLAWIRAPGLGASTDPRWHPVVTRRRLGHGYVAEVSTHAHGDTVDVTIVHVGADAARPPEREGPCTASAGERRHDGSLDMGTAFDCLDPKSGTRGSSQLDPGQRVNRTMLIRAMARRGFVNYPREWWHFTLGTGTGPGHDFEIVGKASR